MPSPKAKASAREASKAVAITAGSTGTPSETAQSQFRINEGHIKATEAKEIKAKAKAKVKAAAVKARAGRAENSGTQSITARIAIQEDNKEAGSPAIKEQETCGPRNGTRGGRIKTRRCSSAKTQHLNYNQNMKQQEMLTQ